jgi:dihydroxyacetone kinase-like protein
VARGKDNADADTRLGAAFVLRWLEASASAINGQRDHLTQLDAAIGDADHGINMDRGFAAGLARLRDADGPAPGRLLQLFGERLILSVGGAAGPLYGSSAEGDKTMVDAYRPAVDAFQRGLRAGRGLGAFASAREAAETGMRATIPMVARKGRASYLGPRSAGHQDPGATSTALLFGALDTAATEELATEAAR